MAALKKGDFIRVEYTAHLASGQVFDTTDKDVAKKEGIENPRMAYGPIVVCLGEHHLVHGLDEALQGKDLGEYTIKLDPEHAFGKKSAKLVELIPISKFRNQGITPQPGLAVNVDGKYGEIRRAAGGRVLVDFNHPLAGQDVKYTVKILGKVEDPAEQIKALLSLKLNMRDIVVAFKDGEATVVGEGLGKLPAEFADQLCKQIKELVGSLTGLVFADAKEPKAHS